MRVLITGNTCPPRFVGGAELMAHEQARALASLGHDVRVFAGDLNAPFARHERSDDVFEGIPIHRIATVPEDYSPEYLNFLHPRVDAHFQAVLDEFRPDILHCHNLIGLSAKLPMIAAQQGIPVVCTLHDLWGFCLRNTAIRSNGRQCDDITQCQVCLPRIHDGRDLHIPMRYRKDFIRLALDHVDMFVAPSRYIAGRYAQAGLPADRITVLPNGVDVARFHPAAAAAGQGRNDVTITYAGYLGTHKGVGTLVEAVSLLLRRPASTGQAIVLQLVGEGPEREAYLMQAEALGIAGNVRFAGKVQPAEMRGIYAGSDIVVLPSIWGENQPVCLMEAMACGLPVVGSREGGIPELIADGQNGLLFAAGNAQELAAALARLVDDPALRTAMGQAGRARVEDMAHTTQARRLLDLYTSLQPRAGAPRKVIAVIGPMHEAAVDEAALPTDSGEPGRHFIPLAWIADRLAGPGGRPGTTLLAGFLPSGRIWRVLRRIRGSAIIPLVPFLGRMGGAMLGRKSRPR